MKNVFLYVHSHWDREWYREFEEFRLRLIEVVDDVLLKLQKNELPCFYFDGQTAALEDYLQIYPEKETVIKKLIKEKRLYIGPFYCSADSFLISAEFMLRNLFIGTNYSRKFGCNDFIGYLSDTFGHSASVPNILKSYNIKNAMLWRGLGSLPSEFVWNDVNATYLIQGYFQDVFSTNLDFDKKAEIIEKFLDKIAERSSDNILLPCGADHLKVADEFDTQVKELNKRLKNYNLKLSTPFEYLEKVKKNHNKKVNGEFLDETKNFLLKGVYSSRNYQKRLNALCQWDLSRITEPMAALSHTLGYSKDYQREIDFAYKNLIKNHAHDSNYGCSTDKVHKDVDGRYERVYQISEGIRKRIERDLSANFNDKNNELCFFNLSNFDFSGTVEFETNKKLDKKYNVQLISTRKGFPDKKLYDAREIPITEDMTTIHKYLAEVKDLKPFSISENKTTTKKTNKITNNSIENDYISLKVKKGKITVTDKIHNITYENFIEITDRADVGDSYTFGALKNDSPICAKLIQSKIKKDGKLQSTLRLVFEIEIPKTSSLRNLARSKNKTKHKLFADISLSNTADFLSFKLDWENKSKNHILQVKFNLKRPVNKTISEDMLGTISRDFDPEYNIYDLVPAPRGIELKTNTAPFQRFVWAQDCGLITKGLNEYEVYKNSLSLTVLRATELISEPKNPTRGTPAGPPLLCPDLQCLGKNSVEFALKFTQNPIDLYKTTEAFYGSVIPFFKDEKIKLSDAFLSTGNKNILVQALKLSENGLIVRLVNVSNETQALNFKTDLPYKSVFISDTEEKSQISAYEEIKIPPRDILTLKLKK